MALSLELTNPLLAPSSPPAYVFSPFGTVCLLACLGGGVAYQQSPLRSEAEASKQEKEGTVEETVKMLVKEEMGEI